MEPITGRTASSPADIATKNVLALNTGMFELYGDAGCGGVGETSRLIIFCHVTSPPVAICCMLTAKQEPTRNAKTTKGRKWQRPQSISSTPSGDRKPN
jgi:hypothetical protein